MKELSIEQKAKAYDEAIERVENIMTGKCETTFMFTVGLFEYIFPVLVESEDERIRNFISNELACLRATEGKGSDRYEELTNAIAWLEKHDEQKSVTDLRTWKYIADYVVTKWCGIGQYLDSPRLTTIAGELQRKYYLEQKQGEQKPTKVEPKFKVGDYIISNNNSEIIYHITGTGINELGSPDYVCEHVGREKEYNGRIYNMRQDKVDANFRLWTVQDAKDGDVLHSTGFHNDCIFIFNGLDNWRFDEPNGDRAVATGYCCLFVSADKMEFGIQGPDCVEVNTIKPATKIQHGLLFQKMKEAGYEWDTEKKELKKVEQKPAEWSDNDEWCLEQINFLIRNSYSVDDKVERLSNWVKFIKDRYAFKPSEEQLNGLKEAIEFLGCTKTRREQLQSLYDDLKKLMEE